MGAVVTVNQLLIHLKEVRDCCLFLGNLITLTYVLPLNTVNNLTVLNNSEKHNNCIFFNKSKLF